MDLLFNMGIVINDFSSSNINNYNDMRDCFIISNKITSRTILMSLNETLEKYATRLKHLNDIFDNIKSRDHINSSQLFYAEPNKIQVNKETNYKNKVCL